MLDARISEYDALLVREDKLGAYTACSWKNSPFNCYRQGFNPFLLIISVHSYIQNNQTEKQSTKINTTHTVGRNSSDEDLVKFS